MNFPNKPWTNGQIHELVPGESYEYDSVNAVWNHLTKATLDSDYQADKIVFEGNISTNSADIATLQGEMSTAQSDISALQSDVTLLSNMSDSDRVTIESNIASINAAVANLDSDTVMLQSISINVENAQSDITALQARADSDEAKIQSLQTQIDAVNTEAGVLETDHDSDIAALPLPVISASQPTGKPGLLWINLNDGNLYFWNVAEQTFVEISHSQHGGGGA